MNLLYFENSKVSENKIYLYHLRTIGFVFNILKTTILTPWWTVLRILKTAYHWYENSSEVYVFRKMYCYCNVFEEQFSIILEFQSNLYKVAVLLINWFLNAYGSFQTSIWKYSVFVLKKNNTNYNAKNAVFFLHIARTTFLFSVLM